jgi:hypothetical protein
MTPLLLLAVLATLPASAQDAAWFGFAPGLQVADMQPALGARLGAGVWKRWLPSLGGEAGAAFGLASGFDVAGELAWPVPVSHAVAIGPFGRAKAGGLRIQDGSAYASWGHGLAQGSFEPYQQFAVGVMVLAVSSWNAWPLEVGIGLAESDRGTTHEVVPLPQESASFQTLGPGTTDDVSIEGDRAPILLVRIPLRSPIPAWDEGPRLVAEFGAVSSFVGVEFPLGLRASR